MNNYFLRSFKVIIWISLVSLMFSSCIPQKKMLYLQVQNETDTLSTFKNERKIEYRVQTGDNLYIRVVTLDEKTTLLLNPLSAGAATSISNDASVYLNSYNISEGGYLDFPMIGDLYVQNKSVEEIKDDIQEKLNTYMKEFIVIVKLVNFNITMLGEVKNPGQYKIYQDNINIFEAVSMASDLTDFANRNKIAIIRQTKTGSEVVYIDMTKRDLLLSDYYYLKPNDIVYAQPVKGKQFTFAEFPYGVVFGFISTTILLLSYIK
jgi:polysaccharide biosynthesis/export protein